MLGEARRLHRKLQKAIETLAETLPHTGRRYYAETGLWKAMLEITEEGRMRRWQKVAEELLPGSEIPERAMGGLKIVWEIGNRMYQRVRIATRATCAIEDRMSLRAEKVKEEDMGALKRAVEMMSEGVQEMQRRPQQAEPLRKILENVVAEKGVVKKAMEGQLCVFWLRNSLWEMELRWAKWMQECLQTVDEALRKRDSGE
ncbi:hypothetical protein AGMMS49936_06780 [Endomicrobiia bacterium]|nr:hypothetical protein AGMMS49936_06780 [Endomicrobiia bacterium]